MDIKRVVEFIKNNGVSYDKDWQDKISKVEPNWEKIIANPDNWKELEEVCKYADLGDLLTYEHSSSWTSDAIENTKPDQWNFHSKEMKKCIIAYTFEEWTGEPFNTIRTLHPHNISVPLMVPFSGYIPSFEILHLKEVIEQSGDKKSLEFLNEQIKERERICQPPTNIASFDQRVRYNPSPFERWLISRLLWMFKKEGFSIIPLPPIYLSSETPPLFLLYPKLAPEFGEKRNREVEENNNKRNREFEEKSDREDFFYDEGNEGSPEWIDIEEILGCYSPNPGIILYISGIEWVSKKFKWDKDALKAVVLVHEISHWIMHMLPSPSAPKWDTELYTLTESELHETWAQLLTYWISELYGNKGNFKDTFEKLNIRQSPKYKNYKNFLKINRSIVINSLVFLRKFKTASTLKDFEALVK